MLGGNFAHGHNVTDTHAFFREKIAGENDLDRIANCFTNRLTLVFIAAENHEDAFRLFETLNDRGLELSAVDLIKNNMLSSAAKRSQVSLDFMIKAWEGIVSDLEGLDKIRFFRQFLLAHFPGKVFNSALYAQYKTHIAREDNRAIPLIESISEAAEYYKQIHEQSFLDSRLNTKMEDLLNLKATTSFTLLLRLLALKWLPLDILQVVPSIEAFSLRRAICGRSTNEMDTIYNQVANLPEDQLKAGTVQAVLRDSTPSDAEFVAKFNSGMFRQDSQTKYTLEQFEYDLVGTGEKKIANRQSVHIEHIIPQTITTKKSMKSQGGDWTSYLGDEAEKHGEYYQRIGNLTLLAAELNVPASNNPFAAKQAFYKRSEFRLNVELCLLSDWRIEQIQKRSEELSHRALSIWRV